VGEAEITSYLHGAEGPDEMRLSALQTDLKCGTNCGSCLPELKRLVRGIIPLPQVA
jgi:assimilatory nitrate reductase catalytic subunit